MRLPLKSYAEYLIRSKNLHRIHSPFVFSLYSDVIKNKRHYYIFDAIEQRRKELLSSTAPVLSSDPGAGSHSGKAQTIGSIAAHSLISPAWGRMLFRLVVHHRYKNMLELGTSLGISGAYLAAAAADGKLTTIEGRPEIAREAQKTFEKLRIKNCMSKTGLFAECLHETLNNTGKLDLVYIDGDHRGEALKHYVYSILPFLADEAVVIIDDIRWSNSMWKAWNELRDCKDFEVSIDLLRMGLLFKHQGQSPENFTLYPPV
jgi:predicted O-methyltransferase YrrM